MLYFSALASTLSGILTGVAVGARRPAVLLGAALLSLLGVWFPSTMMTIAYEGLAVRLAIGFSLPVFQVLAAWALHRQRTWLVWVMLMPILGGLLWARDLWEVWFMTTSIRR